MRKTKASIVYDRTKNIEAVRMALGHRSVEATSAYLGVKMALQDCLPARKLAQDHHKAPL